MSKYSDMNLVVSDIQGYAAASQDNVSLTLWAQQRMEDETQVKNELGTANRAMQQQLDNIQQDVSLMASMNESTNANNFITNSAKHQKGELDKGLGNVSREHSLVTRQLLDYVYVHERYTVGVKILKATLIMLAILFIAGVLWNIQRLDMVSTLVLSATTIFIYTVYVVLQMTYMGRRLRERGNKMAWSVTAAMKADMARMVGERNC